ncbi:MAG TPA: YciI family protein [Methylomirabilota bacterium]|jgi:uncharacterized protein YciI|nr:YciI family protein [Methylomirabilota bacterium]
MTELLYRLQPSRPTMLTDGLPDAERDAVAAHVAYLERLVAAGVVVLFGRTQTTGPSTFGIVIFRAAADAERIMRDDPVVRADVMRAEVFPFRTPGPALGSPPGLAPDRRPPASS